MSWKQEKKACYVSAEYQPSTLKLNYAMDFSLTFPSPMSAMVRSLKRILLSFIHVDVLIFLLLQITLEFEGKEVRCWLIWRGVWRGVWRGFWAQVRDVGCAV